MKGNSNLSTSIIEKPLCEKKLAGPLNRQPRIKPYENARSTFEYLIGQQRPQSKPAYQSKSSAKSIYFAGPEASLNSDYSGP
jgi:hypothetical protein